MKHRQFTSGNIDTQLKMISSKKKTKQNQTKYFYFTGSFPKVHETKNTDEQVVTHL